MCGICFNLNYDRSWFYLIIRIHHCATVLYSPIIKLEVTLFAVAFCLRILPQFRLVWHFTLFNLFNVSGYLSLKLISLFFPFFLFFFFFLCVPKKRENFRVSTNSIGVQSQLGTLSEIIKAVDPQLHQHLGMLTIPLKFYFIFSFFVRLVVFTLSFNPRHNACFTEKSTSKFYCF